MPRPAFPLGLLALLLPCHALAQPTTGIALKKASAGGMAYYLSLPSGWSHEKQWPVVIAIESADRDFMRNAEAFVAARGNLPFIIIVPEVITNGGPRYREAPGYTYGTDDWTRITGTGIWNFDEKGIKQVMSDMRQFYGAERKYFLTGWEAGTHTVFAMTFGNPEDIKAVAAVTPNYAGRNVSFSNWPNRSKLPIRVYAGSADPAWAPGKPLYEQTKRAEAEANAHGFKFTYQIAPGKGHGPLAEEVLQWFASFLAPNS